MAGASDLSTIRSIAVVGGGSSGWMAAAHLSNTLAGVEVTLVESPARPPIGVGEATIPFVRGFMDHLGFSDDRSWMRACDATYKVGILFENWLEVGDSYWHPFEYLDYLDRHTHSGHAWLHLHRQGNPAFRRRSSFYSSFYSSATVNAREHRAPGAEPYAYHFDAQLFAEVLRRASPRVRHLLADVTAVQLDERGWIERLDTSDGGAVRADLYIDCSGFRGLLIGRVGPDAAFCSYAGSLFCDRAVVLRMPYRDDTDRRRLIHPFVRASAQSAGWIWSIPLFSRMSSGYVYASRFLDEDDAERELRAYWGERRTRGCEALRIRFHSGKRPCLWLHNCVAVGLAGGFIEPLESTGLALTQVGVEILTSMIDGRYFGPEIGERYNLTMDKLYTDVLEFLVPHYSLTRREDTEFWRAVRRDTVIPESLARRLEVFRRHLPTAGTKGVVEPWMFRDTSWFAVLLGMGFEFDPAPLDAVHTRACRDLLATRRRAVEEQLRRVPHHLDFLHDRVHNRPSPGQDRA